MIAKLAQVFLLLLLPVVARENGDRTNRNKVVHRLFPAAKTESYNPKNLPPVLGVFSNVGEISLATSFSSDAARENSDTKKVAEILDKALQRFQSSLRRYPDFADDYPVNPTGLPLVSFGNSFEIELESGDADLYHGVPEDYEISIHVPSTTNDVLSNKVTDRNGNNKRERPSGTISFKATTIFGVLRAFETLGQLLEFGWMDIHSNGGVFVVRDLPLHISDEPAFPYRGLMIDTARHYLPMDLILDNLDAMAMNKMNVMHWHITDSQSFPYAPEHLPELAEKGAYHPKRIYRPQDVETIVREAYMRGIRVIPEIDMPGHTKSIAASHPDVMSHCPDVAEPMNPTVPETYEFITKVYRELDGSFPDEMVHLGGDEVAMDCWLKDPSIAGWMTDHGMGNHTVELYKYFETKLIDSISAFDKTPIVWQEVFDLNLTIPKNTIIDVWKGFDRYAIQNATNQGHRVVLSGCWYLDHLDKDWKHFYSECDPLNFTSSHKDLLIGGHGSMWGEHCDASNFISRVWPRASSVAERLWVGSTDAKAAAATIDQRIHKFRCRMVQQGFAAGPTGPGVCPTEVAYTPRSNHGLTDLHKGKHTSKESAKK